MINSIPLNCSYDLASLKKYVLNQILPTAAERDDAEQFPLDIIADLHKMGYFNAFIPKEFGGLGASTTDMAWIARSIAYGSAGLSTSLSAHMAALMPIILSAEEPLRKTILNKILEKPSLACLCFTEPNTGSNVVKTTTQATKVSGGYEITGSKCFISNANYAEHFIVVARAPDYGSGCGDKNALSLFYVPSGTKGLTTGKANKKLGHRDSNTSEVFLDKVFVPSAYRIGAEGSGLEIALHSIRRSRTIFSASAIGLCERAWDILKTHLMNRNIYSQPLINKATISHSLSKHYTEIQAGWYLTCAAAAEWDSGNIDFQHSSMSKMFCGNTTVSFLSTAVELFGGYGYMQEYEIQRLYRDAKLYEIIEGASFVQQAIIAKELFPDTIKIKSNIIPINLARAA